MSRQALLVCAGALFIYVVGSRSASAVWQNSVWSNPKPYTTLLHDSTYKRPTSAADKSMTFSDTCVNKLPLDHKGIEVGPIFNKDGSIWAYRNVVIRHCEIADAYRETGIHSDFIRMFGGGSGKQDVPTTVMLDDIYIHDGNSLPIIIQDGEFDSITLRNIRVENTANSPQLVTMNSGSIGNIVVDTCPGLRLTICGRPGSVKTCTVKNSPGCVVVDASNVTGRTGVKITYSN